MQNSKAIVVGAGIGGLVAALQLTMRGLDVTLIERAMRPGGKMREVSAGKAKIDAGPTVLTMRKVFEEIFASADTQLDDHLTLKQADILARHAWSETERLDLYADIERSVEAISAFSGTAEAQRFRQFCRHSQRVFRTLEDAFIHSVNPSPLSLVRDTKLLDLMNIKPYGTLWKGLGDYFHDDRLRQLFARYSTYVGSSPFLAPATLMLVAHVELDGVWLVEGGMHRIPEALARLCSQRGVDIRYGTAVTDISVQHGRAAGVRLATGEHLPADYVVANADVAALAAGRFGADVQRTVKAPKPEERSLSAVTWNLHSPTDGFPLLRHNVFFCRHYAAEFDDIFQQGRLPQEPTVYICAQDRDDRDDTTIKGPERLLCLVNAPPRGDLQPFSNAEIEQCEERTFALLARCGLQIKRRADTSVITNPTDFDRLFPATGGALYGQASHDWRASFKRQGVRAKLPGLYLAGGSVHPGAGVPMAAISGQMAAKAVLADLNSRRKSRRGGIFGGMLTR